MRSSYIHVKSEKEYTELCDILKKLGENVEMGYKWTEGWEIVYCRANIWVLSSLVQETVDVLTLEDFKTKYKILPTIPFEGRRNRNSSSTNRDKTTSQPKIINPKIKIMENQQTNVEKNSQELEFDLERLAGEIDQEFQKMHTKYTDSASGIFTSYSDLLKENKEENIKNYEKETKKILKSIKEDLIEEINKGRTIIQINNNNSQLEVNVGHLAHPIYEKALSMLVLTRKLMLVGPAGTGKTYMVQEFAKSLKIPFYKYSCSRDSSVHDLLGYKQPTSETYLQTTFLNCYENGGIFLVDEYDAMSGDMSLFFNGVADSSTSISVPHRDEKPIAVKHPDFYIVMCGNTWGNGSQDFSGRDFQDMALMDRFRLSKFFVDYHTPLEKQLCFSSDIDFDSILKLRKTLENIGSYLSTRNIEDICVLRKSGLSYSQCVVTLASSMETSDRQTLLSNLNMSQYV